MTQHSVKVDDLNAETEEERKQREFMEEEDRRIAEHREAREAWEAVRTQQVETFQSAYTINDWLRRNPGWRLVQLATATVSERGDYGTVTAAIIITCLMEKDAP